MNSLESAKQYKELKIKTLILIFLSFLSAIIYWKLILLNLVENEIQNGFGFPAIISPFLFAALYFYQEKFKGHALIVGLSMAVCLGIFLGSISGCFEKGFNGIIIQAVLTTFSSVFAIVLLYKNNFIKVNNKFLEFTSFVFSTLCIIAFVDVVLSFIILDWHSVFSGVSNQAIFLNATILLLAYLVFTIELNVIDVKINSQMISNNDVWYLSTELLINVASIYLIVLFLIARLRGRNSSKN